MAPVGQATTHAPHRVQVSWSIATPRASQDSAPALQLAMQLLHATQMFFAYQSRISGINPSGFWHHLQESGQPLRKIVVRIPSPSLIENRLMSNTFARIIYPQIPCVR